MKLIKISSTLNWSFCDVKFEPTNLKSHMVINLDHQNKSTAKRIEASSL